MLKLKKCPPGCVRKKKVSIKRKASRKKSRKVKRKASRKKSRKVKRKASRKKSRKLKRKASRKKSRKLKRKASRKVKSVKFYKFGMRSEELDTRFNYLQKKLRATDNKFDPTKRISPELREWLEWGRKLLTLQIKSINLAISVNTINNQLHVMAKMQDDPKVEGVLDSDIESRLERTLEDFMKRFQKDEGRRQMLIGEEEESIKYIQEQPINTIDNSFMKLRNKRNYYKRKMEGVDEDFKSLNKEYKIWQRGREREREEEGVRRRKTRRQRRQRRQEEERGRERERERDDERSRREEERGKRREEERERQWRIDKVKHVKILGVSGGATPDEIKNAYRKQAMIYHPDKWSYERTGMTKEEGAEYFKQINEANQFLTNSQTEPQHIHTQYNRLPTGINNPKVLYYRSSEGIL
jgi:hypothetical protein